MKLIAEPWDLGKDGYQVGRLSAALVRVERQVPRHRPRLLAARRHRLPLWLALDVVVPGTLFAQAIARWGNFFNQELYGPPTDLPWGITIDCAHRIGQYPCVAYPPATTGFHPLFLYESIWDAAGGLVALWLSHRRLDRLRDGDLASFWMVWYGGGRLALESLRQGGTGPCWASRPPCSSAAAWSCWA